MYKKTIKDVLTMLMLTEDISDNELSRRTEIPQPTITRIRRGVTLEPTLGVLNKLCTYFKINKAQLLGESPLDINYEDSSTIQFSKSYVEQDKEEYSSLLNEVNIIDNDEYPSIKRVNLKLSAGIVGYAIDYDIENKTPIVMQKNWFISRGYKPENLLATEVKGDSMQPGINSGDTIIINTADTTPSDGEVFAINYEGELLIKRMIRDSGIWWLSSDNPDQRKHSRKECSGDICIVIGKVVYKQSEFI